jgi:hypothetical protein
MEDSIDPATKERGITINTTHFQLTDLIQDDKNFNKGSKKGAKLMNVYMLHYSPRTEYTFLRAR